MIHNITKTPATGDQRTLYLYWVLYYLLDGLKLMNT